MKNQNIIIDPLQILYQELNDFRALIENTQNGLTQCVCKDELSLEKVMVDISMLVKRINEIKVLKSIILFEQDYINFCLLLVYGSEMAKVLPKLKNCPENSRKHAKAWNEIANKFVSFLNK